MPTTKPRLTLALDEATYAAVADVADARHVSKATVVRDFLEPAIPILHRMAAIMRHAEKVQDEAAEDFAASLARSEEFLTALLPELMAEFEKREAEELGRTAVAGDAGVARAAGADGVPSGPTDPLTLTGGSESRKSLKSGRPAKSARKPGSSSRKAS